MKSGKLVLIFNLVVLILIIFISLIEINMIKKETNMFSNEIKSIKANISNDEWSKALDNIIQLNNKWDKSKHWWSLFIDHNEIDNISIALKETIQYIKNKDKSSSDASLATLEHYIEHIYQIERISIENII